MKLTLPLPKGIYIKDKFYEMNTDFKTWLRIDEIMNSDVSDEKEKLTFILALAYKSLLPESITDALKGVMDFYTEFTPSVKGRKTKSYSFEKDASYIFSAFYSQYHIDLFKCDMHWWKFKALFNSIDSNTLFGQIVGYRTTDVCRIKNKDRKKFIRKMKALYSLGEENIADALFSL